MYIFDLQVRAFNSKGHSNYSSEVKVTTKVDSLAPPMQVGFDPESRTLSVTTGISCLRLQGVVEASVAGGEWKHVERVPLAAGQASEVRLSSIVLPPMSESRSLDEESPTPNFRLRVKLCLTAEQDHCSDYIEAESKFDYKFKHLINSKIKKTIYSNSD